VTADENWSWNWEPQFDKLGIPWCQVTLPDNTTGDIQVAGEYIVYAIRTMYARAGRKVDVMGHSQGGMSPRWALRWWPDTRAMVDDVVGFAGTNHGTTTALGACSKGCSAADWQQSSDSTFVKALNSGQETFPGISYTEIYTHTDETVQPNFNSYGASSLHGGGGDITNIATQDVCPADRDEHLMLGTVDPVAYAIALDALTHPGPAQKGRLPADTCRVPIHPGVDPAKAAPLIAALASLILGAGTTLPAAPPDACYVSASCAGAAAPSLKLAVRVRRSVLRATVTALEGAAAVPVRGVRITAGLRHAITGADGRAKLRLRPGRAYTVRARRAGCNPATARLR
jgi:hypothetical protein